MGDIKWHLKYIKFEKQNWIKLLFSSHRLRSLVKQLERGEASVVDLKKNLEYAATVLESVYIDETRWDNYFSIFMFCF